MPTTPQRGFTIATDDELDALPAGSWIGLVRNGTFRPFEKHDQDTWIEPGGTHLDRDWLPATLLFNPDQTDDTSPALPTPLAEQAAAIARVREFVRQFSRLGDTGGYIHSVHTDPEADFGAELTVADLNVLLDLLSTDHGRTASR